MEQNKLRRRIVEASHRMLEEGLVKGTWGNVSSRLAGEPFMLITPSGMDYLRMEPEDLVVVDLEGNLAEGRWKASTESPMHGLIYRNRPDVKAIVHTHSPFACAFAAARRAIPVITEELAQVVGGRVEVADYAACGTRELAAAAVDGLGDKGAVLLANHGLVGVGRDLNEALRACIIVEKTAQAAAIASQLGGFIELTPEEVRELRQQFVTGYGQK